MVVRNAGEVVKEFVQWLSTHEIVEQVLQRHARSCEDGRAAEYFGIAANDAGRGHEFASCEVQCGQRVAVMGMEKAQNGQSFVVGAAGADSCCARMRL